MPFYEYRCAGCGSIFERRAAIGSRDDLATCPSCGAQEGRRLVSSCQISRNLAPCGQAAKRGYEGEHESCFEGGHGSCFEGGHGSFFEGGHGHCCGG